MWVVKLGGSLAATPYLIEWLNVLALQKRHGIVVVPGGGVFADQVRDSQQKWKFDDRTAHRMALLAMQQYGLMLASFRSEFCTAGDLTEIHAVLEEKRVAVWMPDVHELDRAGILSGWAVTSDSLSASLAGWLSAERLVLVKSAPRSDLLAGPEELAEQGFLDTAFPEIWKKSGVAMRIFHGSDYRAFARESDAFGPRCRPLHSATDTG
ncbi:MAG: uridylate kinase [Methylococcaceae bacterium]|nr:uridylate kinase [Methylococcaceae bacterium]